MHAHAPLFALFWENSTLNRHTVRPFAAQLDEDARTAHTVPQLFYADSLPLPRSDDPLAQVMSRRRSARAFADAPLDARQLGSLFQAFAGRALPSAGGSYPIEVFALVFRAAAPYGGRIVHYRGADHALSTVGECPRWAECAGDFGLAVEGEPAAMFVLAALPERVLQRYGERGGRFLLIECGQHAQNLALRVAQEGLAGVEAGGLHDERLRALLKLDTTQAVIALGFAVGVLA
jgi:SagB-type dehydrogenase family enzyme